MCRVGGQNTGGFGLFAWRVVLDSTTGLSAARVRQSRFVSDPSSSAIRILIASKHLFVQSPYHIFGSSKFVNLGCEHCDRQASIIFLHPWRVFRVFSVVFALLGFNLRLCGSHCVGASICNITTSGYEYSSLCRFILVLFPGLVCWSLVFWAITFLFMLYMPRRCLVFGGRVASGANLGGKRKGAGKIVVPAARRGGKRKGSRRKAAILSNTCDMQMVPQMARMQYAYN